jgi:hypothetical protein
MVDKRQRPPERMSRRDIIKVRLNWVVGVKDEIRIQQLHCLYMSCLYMSCLNMRQRRANKGRT